MALLQTSDDLVVMGSVAISQLRDMVKELGEDSWQPLHELIVIALCLGLADECFVLQCPPGKIASCELNEHVEQGPNVVASGHFLSIVGVHRRITSSASEASRRTWWPHFAILGQI